MSNMCCGFAKWYIDTCLTYVMLPLFTQYTTEKAKYAFFTETFKSVQSEKGIKMGKYLQEKLRLEKSIKKHYND